MIVIILLLLLHHRVVILFVLLIQIPTIRLVGEMADTSLTVRIAIARFVEIVTEQLHPRRHPHHHQLDHQLHRERIAGTQTTVPETHSMTPVRGTMMLTGNGSVVISMMTILVQMKCVVRAEEALDHHLRLLR